MTAQPDPAFSLAAFLVASARDALEGPPVYGAFRLLDAAGRVAATAPDDPFLAALRDRVEAEKHVVMSDRKAFAEWADRLLRDVAVEAKRRNFEEPREGGQE